jgi:two-component system nitrate/nitrite response regulator NarL
MMDQIKLVIADDHPLYREGVARSLSEEAGILLIGQAKDAQGAMALTERLAPNLVLMDVSMPHGGGIGALRGIMALPTPPKVAMLTASEDGDDVMRALKAGAVGYILKGIGSRELVRVVRNIFLGQTYVSPLLAKPLLAAMQSDGRMRRAPKPIDDLSRREEDILKLVSEGKSNREVGNILNLREKTVKHYMTSILLKLHVRNRVEAALLAKDHWKF